ncbi:hypothetical protein GCM10027422_29000 [Hymenobacter arcticus]
MTQAEFQDLLQRYGRGECSAAETQQVEAWYAAMRRGQPTSWRAEEQARLGETLWRGIEARRQRGGRGPAWVPLRWAAAALLVLSLGVGLLWRGQQRASRPTLTWVTRQNPAGPTQQLTLPDGSQVWLRPGGTLRYQTAFGGPRREVYLTGEAFFDVRHDAAKPFQVYTNSLVTTVLGTAFWVRAPAGQPEALVRVQRGKVRVSARTATAPTFTNAEANPTSVVLLPNQQAVCSARPGRARQLRKTLADQPVALRPSQQLFTNEPVGQVLAALSQEYGIAIAYDPAVLRNCTVNLAFTHETLYQRLDLLCQALDASYERTDEQILFRSTGCAR